MGYIMLVVSAGSGPGPGPAVRVLLKVRDATVGHSLQLVLLKKKNAKKKLAMSLHSQGCARRLRLISDM